MALGHQQYGKKSAPPPPPADDDFVAFLRREIDLRSPSADLFDRTAERIAATFASAGASNKPTQVRRFYDELLRFRSFARQSSADFSKLLPLVRMLNAKVAYAWSRKGEGGHLVDGNFKEFVRVLTDSVDDLPTLENACTLFEAVIGFSPRN
ncbi:MAG: type III-A CRISPR-associated protein Csm2 [Sphingomonadaceae bacterium]